MSENEKSLFRGKKYTQEEFQHELKRMAAYCRICKKTAKEEARTSSLKDLYISRQHARIEHVSKFSCLIVGKKKLYGKEIINYLKKGVY